jgi:hypothetical protein
MDPPASRLPFSIVESAYAMPRDWMAVAVFFNSRVGLC